MRTRLSLPLLSFALLSFFLCCIYAQQGAGHGHSRHNHLHAQRQELDQHDHSHESMDIDFLHQNLRRDSSNTTAGQTGGSLAGSSTTDFTCGPNRPCSNGACCGSSGWCGYSPTYCGTGCQSNCNAKAECGQYAASPGATCPLNVCCSEFGFCGTTSDFCAAGCQSNCNQPKPSSPKSNTQQRIVAYYETWSDQHNCGVMQPEDIPYESITHLNVAFGYINPSDYSIEPMPGTTGGTEMFKRITNLRAQQSNLQVLIALGGWSYTDPGAYRSVFTNMVSSVNNRQRFIKQLISFLTTYGFNGVDFDWEYPGAPDRGGNPDDGKNYVLLMQELQAALGALPGKYYLTFTAPTSYWYLRWFDLPDMLQYVDWINLMAYDLHGVWDRTDPIGAQVLAHTNLTEIDLALDLFWRNEIEPNRIVLGLAFYGRSFQLTNPRCWQPGCPFGGAGEPGKCVDTAGILSYQEITDILKSTGAKGYYDSTAAVNYFVYGQNSWVSYDDERSFQAKINYANNMGLGGLMIWAIDLDDTTRDALSIVSGQQVLDDPLQYADYGGSEIASSTDDVSKCVISDCGKPCDAGYTAVGRTASAFGKNYCNTKSSSNARYICCPSFASPDPSQCAWHDQRAQGGFYSDCNGKCNVGDIQITDDSYGWVGGINDGHFGDQCGRGGKVFCCQAGNMKQYLDICQWSDCLGACPSNLQHVLTTDAGGPTAQGGPRCDKFIPPKGSAPATGAWTDPTKGTLGVRKLCCPKADSFKNCAWKSSGLCSQFCPDGQITLDTDAQGPFGYHPYCSNGREQVFCCDPPAGTNQPFAPFNLQYLFPAQYLPPADAIPQYDLVSFGPQTSKGDTNPNDSGVAFFLMAGSSTLVNSMRKRDSPGLEFVTCPVDPLKRDFGAQQVARVICVSENIGECFGVRDGGVAGTVVQMPEHCAEGTYVRAVSLTFSKNQTIDDHLARRNPTSVVYDFTFDYNLELIRRDAGTLSIRMDYSNLPGYWNTIVNTAGVNSKKRDDANLEERDDAHLQERYFAPQASEWRSKFQSLKIDSSSASKINVGLKNAVYYRGQSCDTVDGQVGEAIGVGLDGKTTANLYYGFSMVATWNPGSAVQVHEAAGFVRAEGSTDASFKIGGTGVLDSSQKFSGEGITQLLGKNGLDGQSIFHGWASFQPYTQQSVFLATLEGSSSVGGPSFDGYMTSRVVSNFGKLTVTYPGEDDQVQEGNNEGQIPDTVLSKGPNILRSPGAEAQDGTIIVEAAIQLGVKVDFNIPRPWQNAVPGQLPDMSVKQTVGSIFTISSKGSQRCLDTQLTTQFDSKLSDSNFVGWPEDYDHDYYGTCESVGSTECWSGTPPSRRDVAEEEDEDDDESIPATNSTAIRKKRQNNSTPIPQDPSRENRIPSLGIVINDPTYNGLTPLINCNGCGQCSVDLELNSCCGCAWLLPEEDLPGAVPVFGDWEYAEPGFVGKRSVNVSDEVAEDQALPIVLRDDGSLGDVPLAKPKVDEISVIQPPAERAANQSSLLQEHYNILGERAPTQVGWGTKEWSPLCAIPDVGYDGVTLVSDRYPQYPDYSKFNDLPAANLYDVSTRTNGVIKYFHNATTSCTDFTVQQAGSYDTFYKDATKTPYHCFYATEHVFESQTIARFFNNWLQDSATPKRGCYWIGFYMSTPHQVFGTDSDGDYNSFMSLVTSELGSQLHPDRLTVFLDRPNGHKGRMFGGAQPVSQTTFGNKAAGDEQLLVARELGMVFSYMNHNAVWGAFCASYNAILTDMQTFDNWINNQQPPGSYIGAPSNMAQEWPKYVRSELDNVVNLGRSGFRNLNLWKVNVPIYIPRWALMALNINSKIKLDRTDICNNLPPTAV